MDYLDPDLDPSCTHTHVTCRELEILRLVNEGLARKTIAEQLCISIETLQTHLKNIRSKLGVSGTPAAVAKARGRLPLLVFTLGAALFALAARATWWVFIAIVPLVPVHLFNPGQASNVVPLRFLPPTFVLPAWSVLSALGVVIAGLLRSLLWIRRPPWLRRIVLASVALWAVLVTAITITFVQFVLTGGLPPHPPTRYVWHGVHLKYPANGFWLALGALLLIWIGTLALARARRHGRRPTLVQSR